LPKKTCSLIRQAGADYLIALKANQPHLFAAAEHLRETTPHSVFSHTERTRDRVTTRTVEVFTAPSHRPFCDWPDLAAVVCVHRSGTRRGKPHAEHMFYISSRLMEAQAAAEVVRGHWQIENGLHWVKDAILKEDACTTHTGNAPQNLALLRSLAVTLFRLAGHHSIKSALRRFAHDIPATLRLLE
jgi:predicted transposase YbfD/YdcC